MDGSGKQRLWLICCYTVFFRGIRFCFTVQLIRFSLGAQTSAERILSIKLRLEPFNLLLALLTPFIRYRFTVVLRDLLIEFDYTPIEVDVILNSSFRLFDY